MASMIWDNGSTQYSLVLPEKDGIRYDEPFIGNSDRTLSGKRRVDEIIALGVVSVSWRLLTESERDSLRTAYDACAKIASTLTMPDGKVLSNVLAIIQGWREGQRYDTDDNPHYDVDLVFEETE